MISIQVATVHEKEAENMISALLENDLIYTGFTTGIKNWRRKKTKVHYNFSSVLTGFTRAILYKEIENFLHHNFSHCDYILFSSPLMNLSGQHEAILKKELKMPENNSSKQLADQKSLRDRQ